MKKIKYHRKESDPPLCTEEWGWRFHHLGIPTAEIMPGARFLPSLKFWVSGFERSPFGIEWMRFETGSPVDELVKRVPHLAFEVDDIDQEISRHNLKLIGEIGSPMERIRVAMIEYNGAPVELIEFT